MSDRYDTTGNSETQYEAGSDDRVLRNLMGVRDPASMDEVELDLLEQLYDVVLTNLTPDQPVTAANLYEWHRRWLFNVYPWAGRARSVNLSKGTILFAPAGQVPRLMANFDQKILAQHTPCQGMPHGRLVEAIAITHVEFILIHPFREGNGRLARLLSTVMAVQAGCTELDFSPWDEFRDQYFAAIHAGLDDYGPMKAMVSRVLPAYGKREDGESSSPPP